MRFAHQRISPIKGQISTKNIFIPSQVNYRLESQKTYLHYNNAIYMGGMISYKRNGHGIMLLDDGTSIVSEYCFDTITGHNVIFRENCIMSVLFLKNNSFEIVLRTGQCIIKLPFNEKENLPNGSGVLIDYQTMSIYHILFQSGRIIKKIAQTNKKIIQKVMNQELKILMDQRHQKALKFNLKYDNGIKILKEGKNITVGYIDNRYNLQGVGFKLKVNQDSYDDFAYPLQLKCIQRGFFARNRLQNYGQRYFSNGNLYIGEFQDDGFNGQGLLLYPHEQKWVFGTFQGQKLKKMININLGEADPSRPHTIKSCLREIHEYNTKQWMCNEIEIFDWQILKTQFLEAFKYRVTDVVVQKERLLREESERLGIIQQHFSFQLPSNKINRVMEQQMNKNMVNPQKIVLNQYSSLKPKVLEINPRNIHNQNLYLNSKNSQQSLSPSKILTPTYSNWKVSQEAKRVQSKYQTESNLSPQAKKENPMKYSNSHSPFKRFNYQTKI